MGNISYEIIVSSNMVGLLLLPDSFASNAYLEPRKTSLLTAKSTIVEKVLLKWCTKNPFLKQWAFGDLDNVSF